MNIGVAVVFIIIALIVGLVVGGLTVVLIASHKKSSAEEYLQKVIVKAQNQIKDSALTTRENLSKEKAKLEKEQTEKKSELRNQMQLLQEEKLLIKNKEISLDKKEETLNARLEGVENTKKQLKQREYTIDKKQLEIDQSHTVMLEAIEKAASMTRSEAKQQLLDALEQEARKESVKIIKEIEEQIKEESRNRAKEIISTAIQRTAVEYSSELSISTVALPSDELKGRIIGREGRNIRALEQATGVDFIVDDTPEAIVLSCFDPIRREIARLTLEKLISDGRIHPSRIEEAVEKMKKEVENSIKEAGEAALYELGITGMHPEIVKTLGKLRYRTSYGQNQLKHSIEVAKLAAQIAAEIGADVKTTKRGAILHDLGKAIDYEVEGTHVQIGVALARKYRESDAVIHCIEAHHFDVEVQTAEAAVVQMADAISGARPGARRESAGNYIARLEQLESIANSYNGVEKSFAVQAGREIRILVKPEQVDDTAAMFMAKEIAQQIENEMQYPGQIKVNVIRELRTQAVAK